MKKIKLSNGMYVKVDNDDYERLSGTKWQYTGGYAAHGYVEGGKVKHLLMHRLIMNAPDGMEVDHINRDCLDNRKGNLRLCTHAQNIANTGVRSDKTSCSYRGVYYNPLRRSHWYASIMINGKRKYLGAYRTPEEARDAYNKAAGEVWT